MLKNEIEQTLREFIPHSASYCIPDLVKAIMDLIEKQDYWDDYKEWLNRLRIGDKRKDGGEE